MKTIIITGASGGIGADIAKTLDKEGNKLILLYNKNFDKIKELEHLIKCPVLSYSCDLTNPCEIEKTMNEILKVEPNIYALINCAGISVVKQIQDYSIDEINRLTAINLTAPMLLSELVSKSMISNKEGRIINISSMWGVVGASMESVYSATKGGLNTFTLALAKELGPSKICVNSICPGLIDTTMNKNLSKEAIDEVIAYTPVGRIGKTNDISSMVEYLLREDASFITGQIITIDGGFSL